MRKVVKLILWQRISGNDVIYESDKFIFFWILAISKSCSSDTHYIALMGHNYVIIQSGLTGIFERGMIYVQRARRCGLEGV